jgi:hypothetical protein
MMLEMGLQVVLVVLLLVSIGWSALLHRRLAALRQGSDGISRFVGDLVDATTRAEAAVREMRALADGLARQWQRQRGDGEAACAELRRLMAEAEGAVRELRRAAAPPFCPPGDDRTNADKQPSGARGGPARTAASAGGDPSAHAQIRDAIRALR